VIATLHPELVDATQPYVPSFRGDLFVRGFRKQKMNMLGFTAGDSLSQTTVQYRSITDWIADTSPQEMTPQQGVTPALGHLFSVAVDVYRVSNSAVRHRVLVHPVISGGAEGNTGLIKDDEGIKRVLPVLQFC
jgi:hypothetical protein